MKKYQLKKERAKRNIANLFQGIRPYKTKPCKGRCKCPKCGFEQPIKKDQHLEIIHRA